ncbi:uncharacterized protein LOC135494760 [Lineus longissimus]|uniref:uncharacterized protein LOC135494760 n=1 Tax=Lineus longissimus TaxID=88925 RepID=UPI00315CBC32
MLSYRENYIIKEGFHTGDAYSSPDLTIAAKHILAASLKKAENAADIDMIDELVESDEEEPYCLCGEPNDDAMILCDVPKHAKCEIEWHHYTCVGPSPDSLPDGDWICDQCILSSTKSKGI